MLENDPSYTITLKLQEATYLGSENVFVAIHDSSSSDNTKGALQELRVTLKGLGVIQYHRAGHHPLRRNGTQKFWMDWYTS